MSQDRELYAIFILSCQEQLKDIENSVLDLETAAAADKAERIAAMFRKAHSIKGDAGSLGLARVIALCHAVETLLQGLSQGRVLSSGAVVDTLLASFDVLKKLILSREEDTGGLSAAMQDLARLVDEAEAKAVPADPEENGKSRAGGAGVLPVRISALSIRADRLDLLVDWIGELAVAQGRLTNLARAEKNALFLDVAEDIERLSLFLRNQVLEMRLVPLKGTFAKLRRLVRDLSRQLGKEVEFLLQGEELELDKDVIEGLNAPLVHLLRNALDHGMETPGVRAAKGKPGQGRIRLSARQMGSEAVIEVEDDGAGIDGQALHARAVAEGRLDPARALSPRELLELVFLPGLSTAEEVNTVSGRGVGMDAVRDAVSALRGGIDIQSAAGQGTLFRIHLPQSLAIMDCLQVRVGGDVFFFHLDNIVECIELPLAASGFDRGARLLNLRGAMLPLFCLRRFFSVAGQTPDPAQAVVVRVGNERFGVVVDEVLGRRQAVFKALGPAFGRVEGVLGAAACENGDMALIVDARALLRHALRQGAANDAAQRGQAEFSEEDAWTRA